MMGEVLYEVYQIECNQSDRRCGLRHSELGLPGMWRKNGGGAGESSSAKVNVRRTGVSLATILAGYEINSLHTFLNPSL
jgi:hypothetical protein